MPYVMLLIAKLDILVTNYSPGQRIKLIKLSTGERDLRVINSVIWTNNVSMLPKAFLCKIDPIATKILNLRLG